MKIIVAVKQVPVRDSALRITGEGRWVQESELSFEINEPDAYALEAGLQARENYGGEVVVLTVGPERAGQGLREALAKGADRGIHIVEDDPGALDSLGIARLMACALEPEKPDLVMTGLQSEDLGYGQTGAVLAELMGLPHASIIMQLEKRDGAIRVKRELEQGWFQFVELPLPALLTIQSGISKLRYATLMGIKRAKSKEIRQVSATSLGVNREPSVLIARVYQPEKSKRTEMLEGSPKDVAAKLVEKLKFGARVI